jgi:hypothetical protein
VELFYPETVQPRLLRRVAEQRSIPTYRVWSDPASTNAFNALLRKTVFIELSDGGRIDIFRRVNAGVIKNEQVVTAPQINTPKWDELLLKLRKATGNPDERFAFVYLVDDFTASGTTLLRQEGDGWDGKLRRFWKDLNDGIAAAYFEDGWTLCVHHYIATEKSMKTIAARDIAIRNAPGEEGWFPRTIELTYGMLLDDEFTIGASSPDPFVSLLDKYYDDSFVNEHVRKGGHDAKFGFGACGLPLILEHNTPNNAIAILWVETEGNDGKHAMRPLFPRRQRHG